MALTRVYVLLQPYQTLVREIATPTIPAFATACVQLIKPTGTDAITSTPLDVVETICDAFSTLVPLYPATFRPFSNQTQGAIRPFLAPTDSDAFTVPASLTRAARRLVASQHFVSAKSGGSDEWAKLVDGILAEFHDTADQVFRAVDESWEPSGGGGARPKVQIDQDPSGGGSGLAKLPVWRGIQAGSQRLAGLLGYLGAVLGHATKGPVAVPLTKVTDAVTRVCLMARLSPKTQTWDQALQTTPAIGREEKDELWSVVPDVHTAALELLQALFAQFGADMRPYASETLDHLVRVFNSGIALPDVRATSYATLRRILAVAGPTLPKAMVDMLQPVVGATCRDLQEDAGHLKPAKKASTASLDTKKNSLASNADLFLQQPGAAADGQSAQHHLGAAHRDAASALLTALFTSLDQKLLKPSLRSLLDQTAILSRNRDAMVASVLNPYTDPRGRRYPSILPHLTQQFPEDQGLEILRSNLRMDGAVVGEQPEIGDDDDEGDEGDDDEVMADAADENTKEPNEEEDQSLKPGTLPAGPQVDIPVQSNPFESTKTEVSTLYGSAAEVRQRAGSPGKRKSEEPSTVAPKRQELARPSQPPATSSKPAEEQDDDDDDDDESVHLNMDLEDDDDDEDDN